MSLMNDLTDRMSRGHALVGRLAPGYGASPSRHAVALLKLAALVEEYFAAKDTVDFYPDVAEPGWKPGGFMKAVLRLEAAEAALRAVVAP